MLTNTGRFDIGGEGITDKKLTNVFFAGLLNKNIMEQLLKHLQNIKVATQLMRVTGDISQDGKSKMDDAIDDAIQLAKNISLNPDVIKSVCDHEWMGLGINLPIRCKKCGEYSSTD